MGMCCPRLGLCQPAISRRSPFPICSSASRGPGPHQKKLRQEDSTSCLREPPVSQSGAVMERIPVLKDGREVSHLAVRFDPPPSGPERPCVLYLHGFGSQQSGEKAEFFRGRALAADL